MKFPFRKGEVFLPDNFAVAKQRIQGLKKRFLHEDHSHQEYSRFMNKLISKAYAWQVPQQQPCHDSRKVWYIPHHGIHYQRKGSLRVFFNCGATFQGALLNSELLQCPSFTSSLLGVLTRFREEPVEFMGDIQAMFHQVKVPKDQDFLHFRWLPDGDITKDFVDCAPVRRRVIPQLCRLCIEEG